MPTIGRGGVPSERKLAELGVSLGACSYHAIGCVGTLTAEIFFRSEKREFERAC